MKDARLYETEKRDMTNADRLAAGADLAKLDLQVAAFREERAHVARLYRTKLKDLEDARLALSTQLDEGVIETRFEVIEVPDDARFMVQLMRKDTNEMLADKIRPMNEPEREAARRRMQGDLFDASDEGDPARFPKLPTPSRAKKKPAPNGKGRARA
jgi:hypothetical protein